MDHNARGGDFAVGLFFYVLRVRYLVFKRIQHQRPGTMEVQSGDLTMTWRPCEPTMLRVLVRAGDRPTLLFNQ